MKLARKYSSFIIKYNVLHHSQRPIGFARFPLKWYHYLQLFLTKIGDCNGTRYIRGGHQCVGGIHRG